MRRTPGQSNTDILTTDDIRDDIKRIVDYRVGVKFSFPYPYDSNYTRYAKIDCISVLKENSGSYFDPNVKYEITVFFDVYYSHSRPNIHACTAMFNKIVNILESDIREKYDGVRLKFIPSMKSHEL